MQPVVGLMVRSPLPPAAAAVPGWWSYRGVCRNCSSSNPNLPFESSQLLIVRCVTTASPNFASPAKASPVFLIAHFAVREPRVGFPLKLVKLHELPEPTLVSIDPDVSNAIMKYGFDGEGQ